MGDEIDIHAGYCERNSRANNDRTCQKGATVLERTKDETGLSERTLSNTLKRLRAHGISRLLLITTNWGGLRLRTIFQTYLRCVDRNIRLYTACFQRCLKSAAVLINSSLFGALRFDRGNHIV